MADYSSKALFKKYSKSCSYFIETGSHEGNTIKEVLDFCDIDKVFSCDINPHRISLCENRFKGEEVELHCLNSPDFLREILPSIEKKSLFWLDAHGEGGGVPLFEELELIKSHTDGNHHIMIDDIPVYFSGKEELLKEKLLEINEDFIIEFMPIAHHQNDYICVAYLP